MIDNQIFMMFLSNQNSCLNQLKYKYLRYLSISKIYPNMIEDLIRKTNEPEFYHNYELHLVSSKSEINDINISEFNFVMEDLYAENSQESLSHWKIIAYNLIESRNLHIRTLLPYVKMNILDNHPLLWKFKEECYECELQTFPQNPSEFLGDLLLEFEKLTGNWLNLNDYFWGIDENYKYKSSTDIRVPHSLIKLFEATSFKHNIGFKIGDMESEAYQPNVKLLIFGNEEICPNNFDLRQPYIIADNFTAM
jgi:hypothetical protein